MDKGEDAIWENAGRWKRSSNYTDTRKKSICNLNVLFSAESQLFLTNLQTLCRLWRTPTVIVFPTRLSFATSTLSKIWKTRGLDLNGRLKHWNATGTMRAKTLQLQTLKETLISRRAAFLYFWYNIVHIAFYNTSKCRLLSAFTLRWAMWMWSCFLCHSSAHKRGYGSTQAVHKQ